MNTLTTRIATVAALALAFVPIAAVATHAAAAEQPAARIRVSDIDLNSIDGQLVLKTRADGAVRKLCFNRSMSQMAACEGAVREEIADQASLARDQQLASKAARSVTLAAR
ncbi:UrcA family protein [Phenylobacterium immobile]|uniref:UrcA family protein n=1 Tax=Phenylobacterium immobile TaxID=21 RepID=UPI000ABE1ACB|nr:UrcA family protein [Phenylobacterium immobile]